MTTREVYRHLSDNHPRMISHSHKSNTPILRQGSLKPASAFEAWILTSSVFIFWIWGFGPAHYGLSEDTIFTWILKRKSWRSFKNIKKTLSILTLRWFSKDLLEIALHLRKSHNFTILEGKPMLKFYIWLAKVNRIVPILSHERK